MACRQVGMLTASGDYINCQRGHIDEPYRDSVLGKKIRTPPLFDGCEFRARYKGQHWSTVRCRRLA